MSVILQFAIFPTDKGSSVSEYVSKAIDAVRACGFTYQLTPMSTIVETETLEEALDVVAKANKAITPFTDRVYITMNIDIRNNQATGRMQQKLKSIQDKIGEVNI